MMKRIFSCAAALTLAAISIPASAQNADADRLAAAKTTVSFVFPAGTYARVMNGTMDGMMSGIMDGIGKMPMRDLAAMGGLSEEELSKLGDSSLNEMMLLLDPNFKQRTDVTMRVMMQEMGALMTTFEPAMQQGLAEAYAKKFTAAQLQDLNSFFATPSGRLYASESMVLFMDPAVMSKMQEMMPALIKQMPEIIGKVQAAAEALPKPRKATDLSKDELAKLAKLLGVSEKSLLEGGK